MISKSKIKYIRSLELKKNRREEQAFLAEGHKLTEELLGKFPCRLLVATGEWLSVHPRLPVSDVVEVSRDELTRASLLKTPQDVLAVFEQPKYTFSTDMLTSNLCLALDDVQDPGNLGTIVRIADWFGIKDIFCSTGTADIYNPKTVQATMGAIARVRMHYGNLPEIIRRTSERQTPIFGTFLDGGNIYSQELSENGIIVMGNEGNGISPEVSALITRRLLIPNYPAGTRSSESLNVAVATAVVCAEFRRRG